MTSGLDGSYIADNFVSRSGMPDFSTWPYSYSTLSLVLSATDINNGTALPDETYEDHQRIRRYAKNTVAHWKSIIEYFENNHYGTVEP